MAATAASMLPCAVSRMNDELARRLRDALQQLHAVHARHLEVGDDNARAPGDDFFQALHAIARGFGAISPGGDQFSQPGALVFFVFDDQYFFGIHRQSGPQKFNQFAQFCIPRMSTHSHLMRKRKRCQGLTWHGTVREQDSPVRGTANRLLT